MMSAISSLQGPAIYDESSKLRQLNDKEELIQKLAAERLNAFKEDKLKSYQEKIGDLRGRAESARKTATIAKWVAVASVIVTIVMILVVIII